MRTTLALDDDVIAVARDLAHRRHLSLGEAVSELARAGIRANNAQRSDAPPPTSRFALLAARDEIITSEHVRDLLDQEGL